MTKDHNSLDQLEIRLQLTEQSQNPDAIHKGIQMLREMLSEIYGMGHMQFTLQELPPGREPRRADQADEIYFVGTQFRIPLDRYKVILRCLCDWLDLISLRALIEFKIPLARMINSPSTLNAKENSLTPIIIEVETEDAKDLAKTLALIEAVLPSRETYLRKAEDYIDFWGELTPAAKENLNILRHSLDLPEKEAEELNSNAEGLFKDLAKKYQHFRDELKTIKQESDIAEIWEVMQKKADTMKLPSSDAEFLKNEHIRFLRDERDQERQRIVEELESKERKERKLRELVSDYEKCFEELVVDNLNPVTVDFDVHSLSQSFINNLSSSSFSRGRIELIRENFDLGEKRILASEKKVLDEIFLIANQVYKMSISITPQE